MLLIEFLRGWRAGHDDRACFLCAMVDLEFSWILKNKKTKTLGNKMVCGSFICDVREARAKGVLSLKQ
jgi:hypothetical protein